MKRLLCKLFGHKKINPTSSYAINNKSTLWKCERCEDIIEEHKDPLTGKISYSVL